MKIQVLVVLLLVSAGACRLERERSEQSSTPQSSAQADSVDCADNSTETTTNEIRNISRSDPKEFGESENATTLDASTTKSPAPTSTKGLFTRERGTGQQIRKVERMSISSSTEQSNSTSINNSTETSQTTTTASERTTNSHGLDWDIFLRERPNNSSLQNKTEEESSENIPPLTTEEPEIIIEDENINVNLTVVEYENLVDDVEEENKFVDSEDSSAVILEEIDFVQLRLKRVFDSIPNNLTLIREVLQKELNATSSYKYTWERAWDYFNNTVKTSTWYQKSPKNSTIKTTPKEYYIAIIAYTVSSFELNPQIRQICSGKDVKDFAYKSWVKFLILGIQKLSSIPMFKGANRFLYRGARQTYDIKVGQAIAFQQFVSTSTSLKIAENFSGSSSDSNTIFELQGPFRKGGHMLVKPISYFQHEDEVLFSPFQAYRVDSKHVGKYYTRYVLIANRDVSTIFEKNAP